MKQSVRWAATVGTAAALVAAGPLLAGVASANPRSAPPPPPSRTIQHLVVIFQENVSFDHYFGTYPVAANLSGEPTFTASPATPSVNGLGDPTSSLRTDNPNLSNPQRLDRSEAFTCDQDHDYTAEQEAFDHGLMDQFVQDTGGSETVKQCVGQDSGTSPNYAVMDYYDGNTVTAVWNYAQNFAMSDNSYGTTFGPSTPGALNVTDGNTFGVTCGPSSAVYNASACSTPPDPSATGPSYTTSQGAGTDYSDADPYFDACSSGGLGGYANHIEMGGQNVGDLLDANDVTWGWFQGGFASPGYVPGDPSTDNLDPSSPNGICTGESTNIVGTSVTDYSAHHEPFQYFASTSNPDHLPPTSIADVGHQDQANHQYDLKDFFAAAQAGNLPAVSYIKAPKVGDGHADYSDPLDEQAFLARTINTLEKLPSWSSTAVIVNYDDSDGWYDHQMGPIVMQSQVASLDALTDPGSCGTNTSKVPDGQEARCGVGPRLPMMVISPFSKSNFVDNTFTTQSSIVRLIEDTFLGGERIGDGSADTWSGSLDSMFDFSGPPANRIFLDTTTGEPVPAGQAQTGYTGS